jgi:hypothetical protein
MTNRLISVPVALIIVAAAMPVLAQDSVTRTAIGAVLVHPMERKSPSRPHTSVQSAVTEVQQDGVDWPRVGMGVTVAVGNLFYIPAKIAYGTLGGVAGGAVYVFSRGNAYTAHRIWNNSLGGDYVLTPTMVTGQEPIHFMGSAPASSGSIAASPSGKRGVVRSGKPASVRGSGEYEENANWAVSISKEIDAHNPSTLEIPRLVNGQSGRSEAKNERPAPGGARTLEFESMPPMSIEPQ